jgi:phosphocarrier protein FPr
LIGIIVVSHSHELAVGACQLALQMSGGQLVPVIPAGGTDNGEIGTSLEKVTAALDQILSEEKSDALVLTDLGSAVMIAQMAIEALPPEQQRRVHLTNAPIVEGAIAAVVTAAGGGDLAAVKHAAEHALEIPKIPSDKPFAAEIELPAPETTGPIESVELPVINPTGLHARPAALFVRTAMGFQSHITVQNVSQGRHPADAKSMMDVASRGTAGQGEQIRITARGEDAAAAISALRQLIEDGFGEMAPAETSETPETPAPPPGAPPDTTTAVPAQLHGIPASEGIAIAPAHLYRPTTPAVERRTGADPDGETRPLYTSDAADQ